MTITVSEHIEDIIDSEIPGEYRTIEPNPDVDALIKGAKNVFLFGKAGSGKTAYLWGLYGKRRRRQLAEIYGPGHQSVTIAQPRETWDDGPCIIRGSLFIGEERTRHPSAPPAPSMRIITEPGDILRHRWDRVWLDEIANLPGILAIDDVGCVGQSDWLTEAVYQIGNVRRANKLLTAWSSNLNPSQISERFTPAIASRITGGAVAEIRGKDRRKS